MVKKWQPGHLHACGWRGLKSRTCRRQEHMPGHRHTPIGHVLWRWHSLLKRWQCHPRSLRTEELIWLGVSRNGPPWKKWPVNPQTSPMTSDSLPRGRCFTSLSLCLWNERPKTWPAIFTLTQSTEVERGKTIKTDQSFPSCFWLDDPTSLATTQEGWPGVLWKLLHPGEW